MGEMSISRTRPSEGDSRRSLLVEIQIGSYVHRGYDLVDLDLYLSESPELFYKTNLRLVKAYHQREDYTITSF